MNAPVLSAATVHSRFLRFRVVILATPLNTWRDVEVSPAWPGAATALIARGHLGSGYKLGVLARGDIAKALTVRAHKFSGKAAEKIAAAGGKAEVLA